MDSPQRRKPREVEVEKGAAPPPGMAARATREVDGGQAAATAVVVTGASRAEESVDCVEEEALILNRREYSDGAAANGRG